MRAFLYIVYYLVLFTSISLFGVSPCAGQLKQPTIAARFHIIVRPSRRVRVTIRQTMTAPEVDTNEWAICVGDPPTYASQKPESAVISVVDAPNAIIERKTDRSDLKQTYWLATFQSQTPSQRKMVEVQAEYVVTLFERLIVENAGEAKVEPPALLSASERKHYLMFDTVAKSELTEFYTWLNKEGLMRRPEEAELDFAYRVLQYIGSNFSYKWDKSIPDSITGTIRSKSSFCGGISRLYVSILQANLIPARMLFGRLVQHSSDANKVQVNGNCTIDPDTFHVMPEFYAEGVGWITADPTAAMQLRGTGNSDMRKYFGWTPGTLLVLNFDRLDVSSRANVQSKRILQNMDVIDSVGNHNWTGYHWTDEITVEELPLKADAP